ncbi:SPOR domain-containing protein [Azovibrio restrictus]|uniref:SPOR domain-containing protein n=1 Tax=Azovibrio restrictus TaxID=146938 RepID=UPI0026F20EB6|nr:SPOR domain-containing protein [Azovibrio restrictus]
MSRDVKSRKPAPKKKSGGGTLIGMFIGLVLGVLIAAGVVWYMNKTPVPFVNKVQQVPSSTNPGQAPMALPGKPGDPVPEKRFQFYDILQGKAEAVPGKGESKPAAAARPQEPEARKEEPKKEDKPGKPHYLQAGSFSKAEDAENLKANLAMMGLEAHVQQVMVQDKTFFRLRLGPYTKVEDANKVRAELAKAGVDTALIPKE